MALQLVVDTLDAVPEPLRALYTEAEGKFRLQVDGIEDTKGLKSALDKERQASKDAEKSRKDLEKKFEGIDPDKMREIMGRFDNDSEAKLIAEGKISEVVDKRMERQRAELERQLAEKDGSIEAANKRADAHIQRVMDNEIRSAASAAGLHKFAIDDALLAGRQIFSLDENGDAVQKNGEGKPVMGKDGKTPFGPKEWIEGMKATKPHWFPNGNSGGGAGVHGAVAGNSSMANMSPTERLTAARAQRKS